MDTRLLDRACELIQDPEFTADLLWAIAAFGDPQFREQLSHMLECHDASRRQPVRDLALLIAGACGEAE